MGKLQNRLRQIILDLEELRNDCTNSDEEDELQDVIDDLEQIHLTDKV